MHIIHGAKYDNRLPGLGTEALAFLLSALASNTLTTRSAGMHMSTAASVRLRSALWRRLALGDVSAELCEAWMNGRDVEVVNAEHGDSLKPRLTWDGGTGNFTGGGAGVLLSLAISWRIFFWVVRYRFQTTLSEPQ